MRNMRLLIPVFSFLAIVFFTGPGCAGNISQHGSGNFQLESEPGLQAFPDAVPCVGRCGFPLKYMHYFEQQYPGYSDAESDDPPENWKKFRVSQFGLNPPLDWFPEINSHEFEVGYGMQPISPGEQLLYGLGMILLQMSANELDRRINGNYYR